MIVLISRRMVLAGLTLFLVSLIIFAGTEILPGDVAISTLGQSASDDTLKAVRESIGLDAPAPVRYWRWLTALISGDLGLSYANHRPVGPELRVRLSNTFFLAGVAALVTIPLSLMLGIVCAMYRDSWFDRTVNVLGLAAISLPEFFISYLLILLFAVELDVFPSLAAVTREMPLPERLWTIALPAITLALAVTAYIMRMTRNTLISVLGEPYIEMAVLKGVPPWRTVLFHALPNALAPIVQVVAFNLAYMVVGIVLVEVVFVYPGIGQYLVDAVAKRDINVVQACGLVFGTTFIGLNTLADIMAILVNPRLRYPR